MQKSFLLSLKLSTPLLISLACLLILRITLLILAELSNSGDGPGYLAGLEAILSTNELPALRNQPIGYSLILAIFHWPLGETSLAYIALIQKSMDVALILLVLFIALMLSKPCHPLVRLTVCTVVILQPFTSTMVTSVYPEQFSTFFTFCGFFFLAYLFTKTRSNLYFYIGAVFIGLAAILRIDLLALNLLFGSTLILVVLPKLLPLNRATIIRAVALLMLAPLATLAWQYRSTGEVGYVVKKFHYSGYMSWLRTWPADRNQYQTFAFFSNTDRADIKFDVNQFPSTSFIDENEKEKVAALLATWKQEGYDEVLDEKWKDLANHKSRASYLKYYVYNPVYRMAHYWLNLDGAQFYLSVITLKPPSSSLVVACVMALKMSLFLLFLIGCKKILTTMVSISAENIFFAVSLSYVFLRTLELGILGTMAWGGLMETRYIIVAYPFLIVVALYGASDIKYFKEKI